VILTNVTLGVYTRVWPRVTLVLGLPFEVYPSAYPKGLPSQYDWDTLEPRVYSKGYTRVTLGHTCGVLSLQLV